LSHGCPPAHSLLPIHFGLPRGASPRRPRKTFVSMNACDEHLLVVDPTSSGNTTP